MSKTFTSKSTTGEFFAYMAGTQIGRRRTYMLEARIADGLKKEICVELARSANRRALDYLAAWKRTAEVRS